MTIGTIGRTTGVDSAIMAIRDYYKWINRANMTIDCHQQTPTEKSLDWKRSGYWSTGAGNKDNNNSRRRHDDHRYKLQEWQCYCSHHRKQEQASDQGTGPRQQEWSGYWPDSVKTTGVDLSNWKRTRKGLTESTRPSITNNQQEIGLLVHRSEKHYRSGSAIVASGRDMDSAIVAIQHERQENRNRNKTGITGSTTGVDF
jgi:hypothetical protein